MDSQHDRFKKENRLTRRVFYYDNDTRTYTTVLEEVELEFFQEVLTGEYGEVNNEERRNKLQNICDTINSCADKRNKRSVESFEWRPSWKERRFINESKDVWLMLIGCTDGTHSGNLEDEWFLYYFKGFAVQLNFEQQQTNYGCFKLETVNTANANRISVSEFYLVLHANNISEDEYFFVLKQALYSYAIYASATNPLERYVL
ncbi:MAG: hypothetical protein LBU53_12980 [Zoogloeaceae bacterium]|jgi:hypothetical protein|nr:hypothetical protein [Zoogloeaceae bacterium]